MAGAFVTTPTGQQDAAALHCQANFPSPHVAHQMLHPHLPHVRYLPPRSNKLHRSIYISIPTQTPTFKHTHPSPYVHYLLLLHHSTAPYLPIHPSQYQYTAPLLVTLQETTIWYVFAPPHNSLSHHYFPTLFLLCPSSIHFPIILYNHSTQNASLITSPPHSMSTRYPPINHIIPTTLSFSTY